MIKSVNWNLEESQLKLKYIFIKMIKNLQSKNTGDLTLNNFTYLS